MLDGEVLAYARGRPLPFALLQTPHRPAEADVRRYSPEAPAAFMAYDLLEHEGEDIRELPLSERRARLEALLAGRHRRFFVSRGARGADLGGARRTAARGAGAQAWRG